MKKLGNVFFMAVIFGLWMTGCSPSSAEIASTIESQVALDVQTTIAALPSVTPVNTVTPLASSTPLATYTPYPTFTPPPTFTPLPTYTPLPTMEPTLENTATAVPPSIAAPVIQATALPATTIPTSNLTIMKTELAKMLNGLDRYRSLLVKRGQGGLNSIGAYKDIDCNESIASRNSVISTISLDVSQDIPEVQSAYAVYLDVAQRFGASTEEWHQVCLEAVANGTPEKGIDPFQRELRTIEIGDYLSTINSINNQLITLEQ